MRCRNMCRLLRAGVVRQLSEWAHRAPQAPGFSTSSPARLSTVRAKHYARSISKALRDARSKKSFWVSMDYVCQGQDGGTVDEGIAREAFIKTITELAGERHHRY